MGIKKENLPIRVVGKKVDYHGNRNKVKNKTDGSMSLKDIQIIFNCVRVHSVEEERERRGDDDLFSDLNGE